MKRIGLAGLLLVTCIAPGICSSYDYLNAGIAARNRSDWANTILFLDRALAGADLTPDQQYVAHLDRAQARAGKADLDGAVADLTSCLALLPGDEPALSERARLYTDLNNPDAALADLNSVIASDPNDGRAYIDRARVHEMQGDAERELEDLQIAQAKDPASPGTSYSVGIADLQLGRADAAAALFSDNRNGRSGYIWIWLALADEKLGKPLPEPSSQDKARWPAPVIDFFQGHSKEDAVFAVAGQSDIRARSGQTCEANFYLGEWRMLHGDSSGAKSLFLQAAATCPKSFIEWFWAEEELNHAS